MNIILFTINNVFLLFLAFVIVKKQDRNSIHNIVLQIATIYIFEIIGIIIILGLIINKLNLLAITLFCILMFLVSVGYILFGRNKFHFAINSNFIPLKTILVKNKYILFPMLIVLITALFKLVNVFILLPIEYDATMYHLPNLVDYIQNQKIYLSEKVIWSNCYPKNIEMLNLWSLLYFRNGVTLKVVQYLLSLLGALAMYGILREENVQKDYAILGALAYLSTPIILSQMDTCYVDTALASIFILCGYFLCRYIKYTLCEDAVYFAISVGILTGIKYSCLGYYAIFIAIFILSQFMNKLTLRKNTLHLVLVGGISLVIGSVWYVVNYINFKNPIYPFKVSLLGHILISGADSKATIINPNVPIILRGKTPIIQILISWFGFGSNSLTDKSFSFFDDFIKVLYDQRIGGLGFQWILIFVPSFILLLYKRIKNKRFIKSEILVMVPFIACFLITPANWWTRYVCFILFVGIYSYVMLCSSASKYRYSIIWLGVLMIFSCYQGSAFDIQLDKFLFNNYNVLRNERKDIIFPDSIRSMSIQPATYTMRDIAMKINDNKYKIVCFGRSGRSGQLFFYEGGRTQNTVKSYFEQTDPFLKNFNVNNYEIFCKIVNNDKPDYIILSSEDKELFDYMETYIKFNNTYQKVIEESDKTLLYQKAP